MTAIDLNADLGEGDAFDEELLGIVSSCNVACGGHTGDEESMAATVALAIRHGVAIGAHPSYPDRDGFGRRSGFQVGDKLLKSLVKQIRALAGVAAAKDAQLTHVKPHGALYNDAAKDADLAAVVVEAVCATGNSLLLFGPPASALELAAQSAGIAYRREGFIDRAYMDDGSLVPRDNPAAVHSEMAVITTQAMSLATRGEVTAQSGDVISVPVETLCIHGDTANADVIAHAVQDVLTANGVSIRA